VLALRPFVADDLPAVEPWFDEAETRRRLGDRAWPRRLLALVDPPARMAVVAVEHGAPVALADVEIDADGRAALAVVVAPSARRRRVATRLLADLTHAPALAAARELYGTVEPGNRASERLLRGAGFRPDGVDRDGFARFALTLPPRW
jgi:RimJ/RimL family protein N-acetyltransferase